MKRITAFFLVAVLFVSLLPFSAFAWSPDDIMGLLPSGVQEPRKQSWLEESRLMYVASEYGRLIYIMRAPRKDSAKLGEAREAEPVTVYAIENGYALAVLESSGEGGWMNCERLVEEYYREGPGPADTLDVKKGVIRPGNDDYFDTYRHYTVKSKNGSSTVLYKGFKTGTGKMGLIGNGEQVTGYACRGNSTFIETGDGLLAWIQTKYLEEAAGSADVSYSDVSDCDFGNGPTVTAGGELPVAEWEYVTELYSCDFALLGLRSDGTVLLDRDAVISVDRWPGSENDGKISYRDSSSDSYYGMLALEGVELTDDTVAEAIREISEWRDVRKIKVVGGIPLALTASGQLLVPEIFSLLTAEFDNSRAAIDGMRAVENAEDLSFSANCIYVIERGGRIHTFPLDMKAWQEHLENADSVWMEERKGSEIKAVDPAAVFDSNSYSRVLIYQDKAIGIRESDGSLESAGLLPEKLGEAVSKWKDIRELYIFSAMKDWWPLGNGEVELAAAVDGKGKIYAEYRDNAEFSDEFGRMVKKEILSWKGIEDIRTRACWDAGTAQIAGILKNGDARVFNGYVYGDDSCPLGSFSTVKKVKDVFLGCIDGYDCVVLLHDNGSITVNTFEPFESSVSVTASCKDKPVSLTDSTPYYGITVDGRVAFIDYTVIE